MLCFTRALHGLLLMQEQATVTDFLLGSAADGWLVIQF